jgi:hypothetical protein
MHSPLRGDVSVAVEYLKATLGAFPPEATFAKFIPKPFVFSKLGRGLRNNANRSLRALGMWRSPDTNLGPLGEGRYDGSSPERTLGRCESRSEAGK